MGFPTFNNPFKRERQNFPGVVIPLSEAPLRSRSTSDSEKEKKDDSFIDHSKSLDRAPSSETGSAGSIPESSHLTIEVLRAEIDAEAASSGQDSMYDRKAKVINRAIQDIGMGRYQWELFALCGFGWTADNLWLQGVALTLTPIQYEFGLSESEVRFTTCALFLGLCIGASFWGIASDIIGRRPAFNCTLFLAGVFGLASGGAPNWIGTCALFACLGLGVGGNLPVDGATFLEFLPCESGNYLTMLSVFWPIGQLIGSLFAWAYIPLFTCDPTVETCTKENNMGWRYLVLTLGAITFAMFCARFFLFHLYESPKYLLSRGRQDEAVASVHGIAYRNKAKTWLTTEILNEIGGIAETKEQEKLSVVEIIKRFLSKFSMERIGPLFANKRLGFTTVILWFCWATIGMGYPLFNAFLPQYLGSTSSSTYITYRNYAITSIVGVPGSILACYTVEIKYIGRKGTMAIATLITGILLFCFTASTDSNVVLACTCLEAFFQNIMYGVLYAYTPEVFPAPNRGTGTGIGSCLNRIAGLCAPLVAIYGGSTSPTAPIYASGALILASFVAMVFLPIETRGRQAL
ncbi:MFS general substrate transporter [Penicillium cinerascens]|uniref:MFS general substrate transporter n=1 Tax=Penicillium cinerascens TaxID=70096 RepID=A0A9W9N313_9EURO|nr:MFS general substrate transporter [Penicillium cinerascens]KAJ5212249.1 MFS general substrate transporter [Penicillium cinerascens]